MNPITARMVQVINPKMVNKTETFRDMNKQVVVKVILTRLIETVPLLMGLMMRLI